MKIMLRAAMMALSIGTIGSAYANDSQARLAATSTRTTSSRVPSTRVSAGSGADGAERSGDPHLRHPQREPGHLPVPAGPGRQRLTHQQA